MTAALPSPFDEETVLTVAAEYGIDRDRLARLLDGVQSTIARYSSVSGWVYELRTAFPEDPLVERTSEAHYLLVPPSVWVEFGEALGIDDDHDPALAALRAVHDRTYRRAVDDPRETDDATQSRSPMVVARERSGS